MCFTERVNNCHWCWHNISLLVAHVIVMRILSTRYFKYEFSIYSACVTLLSTSFLFVLLCSQHTYERSIRLLVIFIIIIYLFELRKKLIKHRHNCRRLCFPLFSFGVCCSLTGDCIPIFRLNLKFRSEIWQNIRYKLNCYSSKCRAR